MKFSIIIPTFNRPEFLEKAVAAILKQKADFEIIICDGGDKHATFSDPRITHVIEKDNGITDAMNKGMKLATGNVFNWSNDDDRMAEGTLEYVESHIGDSKWLYGMIMYGDRPYGHDWDYSLLKRTNIVPQPSVFWKKEAYEEVGPMDETNDLVSDYEYWLRLGSKYTPHFANRIMAYYTLHPDQITTKRTQEQLNQASNVQKIYEMRNRN